MAQGVAGGGLGEPGPAHRLIDGLLHRILVQMVAAPLTRPRILGKTRRRENKLPDPLPIRVREFAPQRLRQIDRP